MIRILLPALLVVCACSPRMSSSGSAVAARPVPVAKSSPSPEPVPDELVMMGSATGLETKGQSLFDKHCGQCHDLPSPSAYTRQEWIPIVQDMRFKAKLSVEEGNLIYDYVASLAKS